ncbi:hypothetical protein HYW53_02660 [Candidatus Giovannonibacteria bacterium]|nr:hypothetical protein [Candidatus Giovannonibacteria bacterium]
MPSINIQKISEDLLQTLPKRAREVLESRFGIGKAKERKTLEAIGSSYGITRERVRQIESYALNKLRLHEVMKENQSVFQELKNELEKHGGIAEEENFLATLAKDPREKNHVRFLLTLSGDFMRLKEDDEFNHRWTTSRELAEAAHGTLRSLHSHLEEKQEPVSEKEIKEKISEIGRSALGHDLQEPAITSWLSLSKKLGRNKLGEWGLSESSHISPRGVRDSAYLVMRHHGSPLHFSEVAAAIRKNLGEKAHVQTVHNELIKDDRFVLVGRGLYALKEWGYKPGIVRDVIKNILVSSGPLAKDKLIERVLKERYVKPSTIKINLQQKKYFRVLEDGRYTVV